MAAAPQRTGWHRNPLAGLLLLLLNSLTSIPAAAQTGEASEASTLTILLINIESLMPDELLRAGGALPHLQYLRARGTWYSEARGVFPAYSSSGQAALLTGRYPDENGVASDQVWQPGRRTAPRAVNRPTDLQAPTLFRLLRRHCPALQTAGIFADRNLHQLFSSCGEGSRHCSPYTANPTIAFDPERQDSFDTETGRVPDAAITAAARAYLPAANLMVLSYAELDAAGHADDPEATGIVPSRAFRLAQLDAQLGLLIGDLKRSDRWGRTVIFLTSTHGMEWAAPEHSLPVPGALPTDWQAHLSPLGGGGTMSLHLRNPEDPDAWRTALHLVEHLQGQTGVYGAWLTEMHSELLNHRTTAELATLLIPRALRARTTRLGQVVLAAQPGYRLISPATNEHPAGGFHGGPGSLRTAMLISGGAGFVRPQLITAPAEHLDENGRADPTRRFADQPEIVDVVPTITWLLGLADRTPEEQANGLGTPEFSGRILHEAFLLPAVRPLGGCGAS